MPQSHRTTTHFYAPPECISGDVIRFPEEELHHATRVLRLSRGDEVVTVDGRGGWYRVRLDEVHSSWMDGKILERRKGVGEPYYNLTIAIGALKKAARFETFVEKAVELGVATIIPIETERSERVAVRQERLMKIALAALKQSMRSRLPEIRPLTTLETLFQSASSEVGRWAMCHEAGGPRGGLSTWFGHPDRGADLAILVGPEGGFSEREVERALACGVDVVDLGARRLRTETAGITVAALASFLLERAAPSKQHPGSTLQGSSRATDHQKRGNDV